MLKDLLEDKVEAPEKKIEKKVVEVPSEIKENMI